MSGKSMYFAASAAVLLLSAAPMAQAAVITIADASSSLFSPGNTIDGNTSTSWLADNRATGGGAGSPDPAAWIAVDLTGAVADNTSVFVDSMTIYGSSNGFGDISRVHISYSADPTFATATFTPLGDFDLNPSNAATPIAMNVTAQYVRIDTLSIGYGGSAQSTPIPAGNPNFYGLAELQFTTGSPAPEPATMGLLGVGLMGLLARRRK